MPGKTEWDRFVGALTDLGFSDQALHGSAWRFTPPPDFGVLGGIHFHQTRPDTDIPCVIARQFGKRLITRAVGTGRCSEGSDRTPEYDIAVIPRVRPSVSTSHDVLQIAMVTARHMRQKMT